MSKKIPEEKWDLERNKAIINGDEYPLFYAKIINKIDAGEMPFILFLGKPGTGKTMASARLGYDLTDKLDFYDGNFLPEKNIHYKNIDFFEKALELTAPDSKDKIIHKPDVNATLNVVEHHEDSNRTFETFINLMRIFGNLLMGDGQLLWRMDSAIQQTHTFRIVSTGLTEEYAFNVYYIDREPDSEEKEIEKKFIQKWKPDLPPKKLQKFIVSKDKKTKRQILKDKVDEIKGEKDNDEDLKVA